MGPVTAPAAAVVTRVSGPLVEVEGLPGVAMSSVVELGPARLPGEVVAIHDGLLTVQAYEYTGGLGPGAEVRSPGRPLSAPLGPGLLGGVYDGLLRPLVGAGRWLDPAVARPADGGRTWRFHPLARAGAMVGPGTVLGAVEQAAPVEFRVLVPPGMRGPLEHLAPAGDYPVDAVVATVGGREVRLTTSWPVRRPRPYRERLDAVTPLTTGQRAVDLLYPLPRGGTAAVPGGFGTGKTVLLQQIAKWCAADVIVYVGCGERGNELADVVQELQTIEDPRSGQPLSNRTVVVANTSNMPMMAREASVYSGVTVAELFRDMGYDAVVIADSTSRWAEALREFSSRTGALPAEEGYPADLASALAAFYERAGAVTTLGGGTGSVTVIGAVSPPGGDLTEPVSSLTQRFVRCVWSLDRDLAYARHYPAVSWAGSFSRDTDPLGAWHARSGDPGWPRRRARLTTLLAEADRLAGLAELVGAASLPAAQRVVLLAGRLVREGVLQQSALSRYDASCGPARAAALVDAVLVVVDRAQAVVEAGVPAEAVEAVDFGPLVRARDETAPADLDAVGARRDRVLAALDALTTDVPARGRG